MYSGANTGANNLITYVDATSGKKCVELLNVQYCQYMPTLVKVLEFTEDQQKEALSVVNNTSDSIRYVDYGKCWMDGLPRCTVQLLTDRHTRRAIIHFSDTYPHPSCLMSVQFMIRNDKLQMFATFRSWELETFAKYDLCMLLEMAKEMARHLHEIPLGALYISASSAHIFEN
jgi:hypothetical protein